jgi:peptidoglycan biosynthesis protein MviN/MurJ (putative lipid II flippase)
LEVFHCLPLGLITVGCFIAILPTLARLHARRGPQL